MSQEPMLSAHFTRMFISTVAEMGIDAARLLDQVGLEPKHVQHPDARIPVRLQIDLWEHAVRLTGDPYLGVHVGEHTSLGRWEIIEYILLNSGSVEEALENVVRYWRLIVDDKIVALVQDGTTARFTFDSGLCNNRHATECEMVYIARFAQLALSASFAPLAVWFMHPQEGDRTVFEHLFKAPVHFDQSSNAFVFSATWLAKPLGTANVALQHSIAAQAAQRLASLKESTRVEAKVAILIQRNPLQATLRDVAARLAMEPRTLQRKLQKEGTGFQHLLNKARKELALTYLNDPEMPLSEIAFRLGFSEPSAFYRAVNRWTGTTAQSYRTALDAYTEDK